MSDVPTRILVLGASGMLGNAVLRLFAASPGFEAIGTVRSREATQALDSCGAQLVKGCEAENFDALAGVIGETRPHVVINCIGLIKQLAQSAEVLSAVPINSLLPHRLVQLTNLIGARLIHVSTDCVFTGKKGGYVEADPVDAIDVYGLSKFLGEVDAPHAVTLRTSIIGHEITSSRGLIGWFLSEPSTVPGYTGAIFSGLPTVELARVMRDFVLPHPELRGIYHVSVAPISKFDLLQLVGEVYGCKTEIEPDATLAIDRSLESSRFRAATGYSPPSWPELIRAMHAFG